MFVNTTHLPSPKQSNSTRTSPASPCQSVLKSGSVPGHPPSDRNETTKPRSPNLTKSPSMQNVPTTYDKGKGRANDTPHLNVNIPPVHSWSGGAVPGGMIGFNAVDPVTKFEIVDPVLGRYGMGHILPSFA
ncbi:hypothetical protein BT69DRAFT_1155331 [Atractiella rhizophila]|nr:hypothetical protein BT69DRAFT_1155331 [Atractiella rhizophila]